MAHSAPVGRIAAPHNSSSADECCYESVTDYASDCGRARNATTTSPTTSAESPPRTSRMRWRSARALLRMFGGRYARTTSQVCAM